MSIRDSIVALVPRSIVERINAVPFGRRLARGAFWTLAGAMASRVLRIPVSIFLARWMGPSQYGEMGIVTSSVDLFAVFASLGLGLTATKFIAELRVKDPARAGKIIAVSSVVGTISGAVVSVLLFVMAPWLATHTLADPHLVVPLRIGTLALFLSSVNAAQGGALYGFEAFHLMATIQAIIGGLDVPFMLGGYFLGGLNGIMFGMVASRLVNWLLMYFAVRHQARLHNVPLIFSHWKHELHVLWHFSVPAALGGIMVIPVNWICSAILVNQPNGYAQMGAYNAASQWYNMLMFLPAVLGSALLPILSDRMGASDNKSSANILSLMMKLNGLTVVPLAIGMTIFSRMIMKVYGSGYRDAWPTLIAVVWTAAILAVSTPVGDVITASGRMWLGLIMNSGWAAVFISSTYLLVHLGSLGLASARLIAYAVHATWTMGFAYMIIRKKHSQEEKLTPELQSVV